MPKRVDAELRRSEIIDAVCRLVLSSGPSSITFRDVAAEAGVSVRLVQYYFGTKANLIDATQAKVGEQSIARLTSWIEACDGSPRGVLEAFLTSFIPSDDQSRMAMTMYIALAGEVTVAAQNTSSGHETSGRQTETEMMKAMIIDQLQQGELRPDIEPEIETTLITSMMPGLGKQVLDGDLTHHQAFALLGYHLDRIFI